MAIAPMHPAPPAAYTPIAGAGSPENATGPEHALPIRTPSVRLTVPLDTATQKEDVGHGAVTSQTHKVYGRHSIVRRDSLERREALLKGKEGSRQRRRWENDRLLSNPWAVAPLPSDYEVRPTYPTRSVPYYLAPLWDAAEFQRSVEAKLDNRTKHNRAGRGGRAHMSPTEEAASGVPKEVRAKLKHARAAKGLLQDLEEQVRVFLVRWNERQRMRASDGLGDVSRPATPITPTTEGFHFVNKRPGHTRSESALFSDTEDDDEIVFIGRAAGSDDTPTMLDSPDRARREKDAGLEGITRDKMVFEGLEADKGAGFARWMVHSIAIYYGLRTWSVTGDGIPPMRSAYVGVERRGWGCGRGSVTGTDVELPRPLWGMV